jgi:DNA adenine methylase
MDSETTRLVPRDHGARSKVTRIEGCGPIPVDQLVPFLKWPGGKRWFVGLHASVLPTHFDRYFEPFLGSGSVYFHLQPTRAILGDANPDVIDTYRGVQRDWTKLEKALARHQKKHSDRYYYEIRGARPRSLVNRAARIIYLNRTCFNGIYRLNRQGHFNVPRGDRHHVVKATDNFRAVSALLQGAELCHSDFERVVDRAQAKDLVFADPPYTVRHNNNGFLRYNESLFSWSDQQRLASALARAADRGALVVCTNANHRSIRDMYRDLGFSLNAVSRFSAISATANSRRQFSELLASRNL